MDGVSGVRVEHQHLFAVPVVTGFGYITEVANWPVYWPGIVRVEPGGRWAEPGDETNVVLKLLGREAKLRLRRFEQDRLVEYDSSQAGLPDARHERRFAADGRGFRYRLVVEFQPRRGLVGICDRVLLRRGIDRALLRTIANLERGIAALTRDAPVPPIPRRRKSRSAPAGTTPLTSRSETSRRERTSRAGLPLAVRGAVTVWSATGPWTGGAWSWT